MPNRVLGQSQPMISPAIGTVIAGEGKVVYHDVTVYGLHRMCVAVKDKYPDVETWLKLLENREYDIKLIRYTEKTVAHVFTGFLWFYWKEG